ncbi:LemA family protein [Propionispora vibrioides]|uniref:LemA family protein n=1 Tax=Propionispora vibrioides TaxID=112903 RepID=UPI00115FBC9A|nr:LemA family protein [Propionispora vibrioides]
MDSLLSGIGSMIRMVIFIAVIVAGFGIYSYNKLQRFGQGVKSANATVLTVIQKRADLVNKLMDIAREYGNHEKLVHITLSNNLVDTFKEASAAMANLNAMAATYPELKANGAYQQLMNQINAVETELQHKREQYNHVAQTYNSERLQIPTVLFSGVLGFNEAPYFDFDNLQEIKEFKTDDGQLLKEMLATASSRAMDVTQKGLDKVQTKLQKKTENDINDCENEIK